MLLEELSITLEYNSIAIEIKSYWIQSLTRESYLQGVQDQKLQKERTITWKQSFSGP